jgi:hypothetical protein
MEGVYPCVTTKHTKNKVAIFVDLNLARKFEERDWLYRVRIKNRKAFEG